MWTALTILFWLLVIVLAVVGVMLILPLRIKVRAAVGEAFTFRISMRPFGRVGPWLTVADSDKPARKKQPKPQKKKVKSTRMLRFGSPRVIRAGLRLIADILDQPNVHKAVLDLQFGAGDPAETGQIYGALTPVIYGIGGRRRVYLNVEPVFDKTVFNARAVLDVRLIPAGLLLSFARFGWTAFGPSR